MKVPRSRAGPGCRRTPVCTYVVEDIAICKDWARVGRKALAGV